MFIQAIFVALFFIVLQTLLHYPSAVEFQKFDTELKDDPFTTSNNNKTTSRYPHISTHYATIATSDSSKAN